LFCTFCVQAARQTTRIRPATRQALCLNKSDQGQNNRVKNESGKIRITIEFEGAFEADQHESAGSGDASGWGRIHIRIDRPEEEDKTSKHQIIPQYKI